MQHTGPFARQRRRPRHRVWAPAIALVVAFVSGCSTAQAPSGRWIDCGPPLATDAVTVLDVERFGEDAAAMERYVEGRVGDYRIATPSPVGIRITEPEYESDMPAAVRRARERAAELGCDLLLVTGTEKVKSGGSDPRRGASWRNDSFVVVALMGRLEND